VALIDHNVSGQAEDAFVAPDLDEVITAWKSKADPHVRIGKAPVDEALERLRDAMAMSDLCNGDAELRTEDFARHRALIWARLRRAGRGGEHPKGPVQVAQPERDSFVAEFLASAEGRAVRDSLPAAARVPPR
jgi:hypothetical protein